MIVQEVKETIIDIGYAKEGGAANDGNNHGAVSVGENLITTYYKLDSLELMAKIVFHAKLLGNVVEIPKDKVDDWLSKGMYIGKKGREPEF